MNKEV